MPYNTIKPDFWFRALGYISVYFDKRCFAAAGLSRQRHAARSTMPAHASISWVAVGVRSRSLGVWA